MIKSMHFGSLQQIFVEILQDSPDNENQNDAVPSMNTCFVTILGLSRMHFSFQTKHYGMTYTYFIIQ